jgi:hypothetical protein
MQEKENRLLGASPPVSASGKLGQMSANRLASAKSIMLGETHARLFVALLVSMGLL